MCIIIVYLEGLFIALAYSSKLRYAKSDLSTDVTTENE